MTVNVTFFIEESCLDDTLIQNLCRYNQGFTVIPTIGFWEGKRENSYMLLIGFDNSLLTDCINEVKQSGIRHGQKAIGVDYGRGYENIDCNEVNTNE